MHKCFDGGNCGEGGYCDKCPTQQPASSGNSDLLMGWQPMSSAPRGEWVLMYEDGDVFKGRIQAWVDGGSAEDVTCESACGQPVCYTPEPTHWAPLHDEPEAH